MQTSAIIKLSYGLSTYSKHPYICQYGADVRKVRYFGHTVKRGCRDGRSFSAKHDFEMAFPLWPRPRAIADSQRTRRSYTTCTVYSCTMDI